MFNPHLALNLTPEQRIAATTLDRPVALIAGAGSGKTSVLVQRYLALLRKGLAPYQILALTFTNEAADELRMRIVRLLDGEEHRKLRKEVENSSQIGTIHSFCYQILANYGSLLGLPEIESIASPFRVSAAFEEAYQTWLNALPKDDLKKYLQFYSHQELRELMQSLFNHRHLIHSSGETAVQLIIGLAQPLFHSLGQKLRSEGLYTFDDLEHFSLRILKEKPDVARKLQNTIKSVLIDEFQDTSRGQWDILSRVIGDDLSRLFVVGDPKQSIYGFRHAEVKLFSEVSEHIRRNSGTVVELTQNFRTQPQLLDRINFMSRTLFDGAEVPFLEMTSGRAIEEPKSPSLEVLKFQAAPEAKRSDLQGTELETIVEYVSSLVRQGTPAKHIALLFRMSDRIPLYAKALEAKGLSVYSKQIVPLFKSYDAIDLLSYLRALGKPEGDYELAAFLSSRYVDLSLAEFWEISSLNGKTLFEKLKTKSDARWNWFFEFAGRKDLPVSQALDHLFRNSNYFPTQIDAALTLFEPLSERGMTIEKALVEMKAWEREEILFEAQSGVSHPDAVTLLTVHGAKGLEFPHVILADNLRQLPRRSPLAILKPGQPTGIKYRVGDGWEETKAYGSLRQILDRTDKEEAKRILYVALTRAKDSLTLFLPEGEKTPKKAAKAETEDAAPSGPSGSWADVLAACLETK